MLNRGEIASIVANCEIFKRKAGTKTLSTLINKFKHVPVLLEQVLSFLNIKPNGIYVDATVGGAGHSVEIAKRLTTGKLVCFDKDPDALEAASKRLESFKNVTLTNCNFGALHQKLNALNISSIDGILFDLGVSSFQLDEPSRGFSYKTNGPIDMRMSKKGVSAFDVVNSFSVEQLIKIISTFGEERFAKSISKKIVCFREIAPLKTTMQLAEVIKSAIPAKFKRRKNPCKKTFQALRIFINNELDELILGLNSSFKLLKPGGRAVFISFHSLEDRLIKQTFVKLSVGCICPPKTPICICNNEPQARILTKKPVVASAQEQLANPRCKSAKLRALEKL